MPYGPQPIDHDSRLATAHQIAARLQAHFGERLIALALYGSLATGTDGPYSDIELECVVEGTNIQQTLEWSVGDWKAEVGISSINVILKRAALVDGRWPKIQGCIARALPLHDPTNLFLHLRKTVLAQPEGKFRQALHELIVGDLYELLGKVRNARHAQNDACLPRFTVQMADYGACLAGLSSRFLYSTGSRMLEESLTLDNLPSGYTALCRAVMAGNLSDPAQCAALCEDFWSGVCEWARAYNLHLVESVEDLLARLARDP